MAPPPRLRILSVGSNGISAFLSWRLQATTSCDVTLVWKNGFEAVSQYGVTMKSKTFGTERYKPRHVVRSPEEAASRENAFDYVILCVKALPDVYDLAAIIESVVTPQHTCILVNTTNTLGVESHLEQRFPTNVVLSLVSGVEITQTGPGEFEHLGSSDISVGATDTNSSIPPEIQNDMAQALAMTLGSGQVDCKVSTNIRQEQFERMIGPIAFHPASVMFETANHNQLLEKMGVRQLVSDVIQELVDLAMKAGCSFSSDFSQKTIDKMTAIESPSTMYQDFQSRRPMELETYLGSPIKLATQLGTKVPRIETLYAVLHHVNTTNLTKPRGSTPPAAAAQLPPRVSSVPPPRNGPMRPPPSRVPSGMMPPRRGPPPPMMSRPPSAQPHPHPGRIPREPSLEGLEEFSHLMLYDDAPEGAIPPGAVPPAATNGYHDAAPGAPPPDIALRERELALRQRELMLREQEMGMRRGPRRPPPPRSVFDEEDEDDYFDPMENIPIPHVDPDNVDMMSITSRRNKKVPNASQFRKNPEMHMNMNGGGGGGGRASSSFGRYFGGRKRASDRIMQEIPGLHESLMDNPMMAYSSNRYGSVDRNQMHQGSRANSLTASRMGDFPPHPGYPGSRRNSQSPGTPFGGPGPGPRMGRPGTAQEGLVPPGGPMNGHMNGGNPSPPGAMRTPVPRHPPGQGNAVGPQQGEQQYGVSNPYSAKGTPKQRSLTGSASASAESGDSGASATHESENSAHSSQISLGAQQAAAAALVR